MRSPRAGKVRVRRRGPQPASGGRAATPGVVVELDIAQGIASIPGRATATEALLLVRAFTEPLGLLACTLPTGGLPADEIARLCVDELGTVLRVRLEGAGVGWTGTLSTSGVRPERIPSFLESRERVLRDGPAITVAVCTRDRPEELAKLLVSLDRQRYERRRILVVDNAPADGRTERLVSAFSRGRDVEYVAESRPGLSWARNRAIEVADTEVIAWADDDEVCDEWWAAEVARGFVEVPGAGAVTGIVVPAELETQSQAWFEQYSGVRRGRGFSRAVFSPETAWKQSPLYPRPPFGAGANMAFRREAIERIGGFDCALGAGTATLAGEDTAALSTLLLAGGTIVYQPSAIVYHRHRRDYPALRRVMVGYGRGLGAYYASMLAREPRCAAELMRLSRRALREQIFTRGARVAELHGFPRALLRANRVGLLQGAFVYPGARRHARRLAGRPSGC